MYTLKKEKKIKNDFRHPCKEDSLAQEVKNSSALQRKNSLIQLITWLCMNGNCTLLKVMAIITTYKR